MLKRTERQIYAYDMVVRSRSQHAALPAMRDIVQAWNAIHARGGCFHERERGTVTYRIGDLDVDDRLQTAQILLRRCDMNAADAVYSHKDTGAYRVAAKTPDEGGDRAAHLVLSLNEETGKPSTYLCHLEGVPGLSHRVVQAILNFVLKEAISAGLAAFGYNHPGGARLRDGTPKTIPFVPYVELTGHPSSTLTHDLEYGEISEIVLIDNQLHAQLGGNQYLVENERRVTVKALPNLPKAGRLSSIISAFQTRRTEFQKARIRFTDPAGLSRSIEYDVDTGNPEQQKYLASYPVTNITPPMDESCEQLAPFLTAEMKKMVVATRV